MTIPLLYSGDINCGKWKTKEERLAQTLIAQFLSGELTDCDIGQTCETYLAYKLNCPVCRIANKYVGKAFLKAQYLQANPVDCLLDEWGSCLTLARQASDQHTEDIIREFSSLVEQEQLRSVEYLNVPGVKQKHAMAPLDYLGQRDDIFILKAKRISFDAGSDLLLNEEPQQTPVIPTDIRKRKFYLSLSPQARLTGVDDPEC